VSDLLKSYRFREERQADWQRLDHILTKAETNGVRNLTDEQMLALPRLYRQAVSSLSYFFVYGARTTLGERMMQFLRRDWPAAVSQSVWTTLLSAFFFFGGWALAFFLCLQDMDWYWTFHGQNFMEIRNPDATVEMLRSTIYTEENATGDGELTAFSSFLFNNNAQLALMAFALGFAFGIPTAWMLVYNGVLIGSMYAVFWDKGLGYEFTGWLMIHGVTELFAIVLAGAAGFVIGGAVAFPGGRTRLASARVAGQRGATIAMGCVIMLVIAAILEGFGRQLINSDAIRYGIAATTLALWLLYFYTRRRVPAP
jgi:uncharacterized membrane protein SpoIIM required for sporulation